MCKMTLSYVRDRQEAAPQKARRRNRLMRRARRRRLSGSVGQDDERRNRPDRRVLADQGSEVGTAGGMGLYQVHAGEVHHSSRGKRQETDLIQYRPASSGEVPRRQAGREVGCGEAAQQDQSQRAYHLCGADRTESISDWLGDLIRPGIGLRSSGRSTFDSAFSSNSRPCPTFEKPQLPPNKPPPGWGAMFVPKLLSHLPVDRD